MPFRWDTGFAIGRFVAEIDWGLHAMMDRLRRFAMPLVRPCGVPDKVESGGTCLS